LVAANAAAVAYRLNVLDDIWTAYLGQLDPDDAPALERDRDVITSLGNAIIELIPEVAARAGDVRMMFGGLRDEDFSEARARLEEADPQLVGELSDLLATEMDDYEIRGATIEACDFLIDTADEETDVLVAKLDRVTSGGFTRGDVRPPWKCAVYVLEIGVETALAIAAGAMPPYQLLGMALVIRRAYSGWKASGCREFWRQITRFRR
jgi:hypothetical protein